MTGAPREDLGSERGFVRLHMFMTGGYIHSVRCARDLNGEKGSTSLYIRYHRLPICICMPMLLLCFCLSCLCPDSLDVTRADACSVCPHLYCPTLVYFPRALALARSSSTVLLPLSFYLALGEWIDAVSLESATERRPVTGMVSLGLSSSTIVVLCLNFCAWDPRKEFEGTICEYGVVATK